MTKQKQLPRWHEQQWDNKDAVRAVEKQWLLQRAHSCPCVEMLFTSPASLVPMAPTTLCR